MNKVTKTQFDDFIKWSKENVDGFYARGLPIADCVNYYDENNQVIGKLSFGGINGQYSEMYQIKEEYFYKIFSSYIPERKHCKNCGLVIEEDGEFCSGGCNGEYRERMQFD